MSSIIPRFVELCSAKTPTDLIAERKYTPEVVKKLGIGYCDMDVYTQLISEFGIQALKDAGFLNANGTYKYVGRAIFRYDRDYFSARKCSVMGFKSVQKNLFPLGILKRPYLLKGTNNVAYICEGETDAVALKHLFPDANIVALGGTTMVGRVKAYIDTLYLKSPKIVFAFDNDEPGEDCRRKAIKKLHKTMYKIAYLTWERGYKDVDECFRHGIELKEVAVEVKKSPTYANYPEEIEDMINLLSDRKQMAELLWQKSPFFFDEKKMFWVWNSKTCCYEQKDEITLLNQINGDTISGRTKTEIINALQQVGRKHIPQPINQWWVQFCRKVVDIETGKEFDADPKYFFTTSIPWDLGESEDTPQLDKYIMEWVVKEGLQDKSYVHTMYEIIAYCCLNNQFLQTMFGLTGSGSNGKSTFEDVLKKFVGKKNCVNSEMKLLSKQFETSALYRKSVCFIPEVDTYDMKNSNRVKQLTGEKELRYEFKGKTSFTEDSVTKLIVLTNSLPVTNDRSVAFYRRWLIVDFPHIFPVGKDVLADIPDVEYNNLARKCLRIMKDLKGKKTFTNGGNYEERKKRYEDRSNPIEKFINEKCNLEEPLVPIPSIGFYKECNKWLKSQGMRELRNSDIKEALKTMDIYVGAKSQRDGSDVIRLSGVWLSWKEEVQKTLKQ